MSAQLSDRVVLVTAGPTREPIDPVRFLSNRSSGKMGFAVAEAAAAAGASVILVAGPVHLPTPAGVERIDVETAEQMAEAVYERIGTTDILIAAAAVSDYRPAEPSSWKIKRTSDELELRLVPTTDILASVAAMQPGPFTVGFAAETHDVERNAELKLERKGLDMIAANQVGTGQGFDVDWNALLVLWAGGREELPATGKRELADRLVELIGERYRDSRSRRTAS